MKANKDTMDLSQLDMGIFSKEALLEAKPMLDEASRQMGECKCKYGDKWRDEWLKLRRGELWDLDQDKKDANEAIYSGYGLGPYRCTDMALVKAYRDRLVFLFGTDDVVLNEDMDDSLRNTIAEKMLSEALSIGRWQELPNDLVGEYHRRKVGVR